MTLKKVSITSKLNLVLPSWVQALKTLKKTRNVWWSNNILVVFWSKVCFRIHNKILVTRNTLFLEILCRLFDPCISMPELVNVLIKRGKYWTYLNFTQTKIGFNFFFFWWGRGVGINHKLSTCELFFKRRWVIVKLRKIADLKIWMELN